MRHKLSLSLEDGEELIASVYGIVSDLPDYRLAFMINQELGLRLTRCQEDRKLYHKAGTINYSEYSYYEEMRVLKWHLTTNSRGLLKHNSSEVPELSAIPLVSSMRNVNYFLWYNDDKNYELHELIMERLKPNPYIRVIQEVDIAQTKNIDNLIAEY